MYKVVRRYTNLKGTPYYIVEKYNKYRGWEEMPHGKSKRLMFTLSHAESFITYLKDISNHRKSDTVVGYY